MTTPLMLVSYLGIFYSLLYIVDTLLRTNPSTSLRYLLKLRSLGLEISMLQIRWSTIRYNNVLYKLSQYQPRLTSIWFSVGAVASCLLIIPSMVLLTYSLWQHVNIVIDSLDRNVTNNSSNNAILQPIVPGVNLPSSQLVYYILSLALSSIYHEAGHGLAAYNCSIQMVCAGMLILAIFPAAYVELPTEHLVSRSAWHQLRIYSAGVWHNLVLAMMASILVMVVPVLAWPLYMTRSGLVVTSVDTDSSVSGPSGLLPGHVITAVQGKHIFTLADYKESLASVIRNNQEGLCITDNIVAELQIQPRDHYNCCPEDRTDSLCFEKSYPKVSPVCLPVRAVISANQRRLCPDQSDVWTPRLENNNQTKLVILTRREEKEYIYIGNPGYIYQDTKLSEYIPRYSWVPLNIPDIIIKMLQYITAFSGGLAVLNVVPSYLLDGQHIVR